jgi:hypothetical protein
MLRPGHVATLAFAPLEQREGSAIEKQAQKTGDVHVEA